MNVYASLALFCFDNSVYLDGILYFFDKKWKTNPKYL